MSQPFPIRDRRSSARGAAGGLIIGQSVDQAKREMAAPRRMPREGVKMPAPPDPNRYSNILASNGEDKIVSEMRKNRRVNGNRRTAGAGADVSFATGRPRDPMFYWRQNNIPYDFSKQDELKKVREFCNTPEAPIWMGDYSFKPIGEVQAGDEVMGWVYNTGPGGQQRKKLVRTKVLATKRRQAPEVVCVTMESGRVIRCTPDHLWANPWYSPSEHGRHDRPGRYKQPEFKQAKVGGSLTSFIEPTAALEGEKERLTAAWLGGLYDGEGSGVGIAQSASHNPAVCERIKESLDLLGLPWVQTDDVVFIRRQSSRAPAAQNLVDFLNWTQPVRRTSTEIDKTLLRRPSGGKDKIVSIEPEGPGEVVSMQTETGNYVAWGYASKNCRLLYVTHPIVSACVDIFSKFPLQGMSLTCKDTQLEDFYSSLFFDDLKYEDYLLDIGREYWTTGECWPLGSFNEQLGVWDDDELLNPDDVEVERSPFMKEARYMIKLPSTLRKVLTERSPRWEYDALMRSYPELSAYASEDALMPVSNILLKQLKFKGDTFNKRGIPILLRGFRAIMQEEMLMAAMDAIADRLYTPLILTKLGASATDLGTESPWIPTQGELEDFEEAFDAAMAGDFRVMTHHFAVDMQPVFGRENMPDMSADFDRIEDRILQVFGLSKTMLQGADQGETYAADALNRDVVSQLLTHYQRAITQFYESRAYIVAEAQEHFDYDVRNGKRYVKMEEVLEVDEESGEERIVEQPKLLIPEMKFESMTLQDEQQERAFLEGLNQSGVPVPYKKRIIGTGMDFDDMVEERSTEQVQLAIKEQETRRETYKGLVAQGLPIPEDLLNDFRPKAMQSPDNAVNMPTAGDQALPTLGGMPPDLPGLAPTAEEQQEASDPAMDDTEAQVAPVIPMPLPGQQEGAQRPPESDEQRANMPKPANRRTATRKEAGYNVRRGQIKEATRQHYVAPDNSEEDQERPEHFRPTGKFGDPKHVGMRIHVDVPQEERYKEEDSA